MKTNRSIRKQARLLHVWVAAIFWITGVCIANSQQTFEINFESFSADVPFEGLRIDNQFFNEFGVSFSLDNGQSPVLAQIGPPATAFFSFFGQGDDTPAPGSNIGEFFLTDDGVLSGLESPPLRITSQRGLRSVEGVVLDLDLGEVFTITAYDVQDELIFSDQIRAGDPNTGDGLATPWKVESKDCRGIYSLVIDGERRVDGSFGLGIDNFRFVVNESSFSPDVSLDISGSGCDLSLGFVEINNHDQETYLYSIDGIDFGSVELIRNLFASDYVLYIKNQFGCLDSIDFTVPEIFFLDSCGVCYPEDDPLINSTCRDCAGVINGTAIIDLCGECLDPSDEMFNQSCADCAGNPNGDAVIDECGDCWPPSHENYNAACKDCAGVIFGTAEIDDCGECLSPTDPMFNQSCVDCAGVPNGNALIDGCGVCLEPDDINFNRLCAEDNKIFIPQAFSPNNDGINDRFEIYINSVVSGDVDYYRIFNKWGALIFESRNFNVESTEYYWDGTENNQELDPGVFVYHIQVTFANGDFKNYFGDVTLIK